MNTRPIYWLHLSDLHFGAPGNEVLHQATTEFFQALDERTIPVAPDLILVSGDVAYSGKREEYDRADKFFADVRSTLTDIYGTCDPLLVCVPGNHDLIRPQNEDTLTYDVFNRYSESSDDDRSVRLLNDALWEKRNAKLLAPLFSGYLEWGNKKLEELRGRPCVKVHTSHIPGDVCVELALDDTFPLCIVGLNSAWLQYSDSDFGGRLSLPTRQFQAVLPHAGTANPLDIFQRYRRALLMLHHPPSWLSPAAQNMFCSEIFLPNRFDICLYGHMHAGRAKQVIMGGGAARVEYQSPSLCGLEHYGKSNEDRAFGFSLASLSEDGELRVWPYKRVPLAGGEHAFFWDQSYGAQRNDGVLIRPKDPRGVRSQIAKNPPTPPMPATAAEGAVLHIALVDFYLAESRRIEIIEFINNQLLELAESSALMGRLEIIDCTWDGRFTLFLSQSKTQQWGALLEQTLQIALRLASAIKQWNAQRSNEDLEWMPQVGIAVHLEHDGHRLPSPTGGQSDYRLVGEGVDHARSMLPKPVRPYILLSGEVCRALRHLLGDYHAIHELLREIPSYSALEGPVQAEIQELTIVPEHAPAALGHAYGGETAYSLCIRTRDGRLLFGDTHVPPKQVRIDQSGLSGEQTLIDRLVDAERVCIVGITNEHLVKQLDEAYRRRGESRRGFWEEIRVVFLAHQLLDVVLDQRCQAFDLPKAREDRRHGWGRGVREVREFFLSLGPNAGHKWECLQFNFMLPFEAQRFVDGENSLVRILPVLPNTDTRYSFCIEASSGSAAHTQLSGAVDAIVRTATPIVEFNVYGHADSEVGLRLGGVVSQRDWRRFNPPEGGTPCFPVSFILLHTDVGGVQRVLLQDRTAFNTGGDFHLFSLISGKVNDEDFFRSELPSPEYQQLAYNVTDSESNNMRIQLSRMFANECKLAIGQPIPPPMMEMVWEGTAVRELNAELGLHVDPTSLLSYPTPFLLDRKEGFQLYIKLFALEVQPADLQQIGRVRPHANLELFTLDRLVESQRRQELSVFLCTKLEEILPWIRETTGLH